MPSFNRRLERDRNFTNPYAADEMASAFSLEQLGSMLKKPACASSTTILLYLAVISLNSLAGTLETETMRSFAHGKTTSGQMKRKEPSAGAWPNR